MSLNISKEEARKATDEHLAYVKNNTRPDCAPHQYATDEIAFRARKRILSLGFKFSVITALLTGAARVLSKLFG